MAKNQKKGDPKFQIKNKKAYHDFEILDELEAGIVLVGTEVKSLREGKASIGESYCRIIDNEVYWVGAHIPPYEKGGYANHDPFRKRKLLLHKREIKKLVTKVTQKGFTLVPLKLYFRNGFAKLKIGLAKGKKLHDKREDIRKRDEQRSIEREWKGRYSRYS
ncbi:MAG: SsrA-binding protein SmpB [Planctomycetota bacterium]|nr:MAG: SsrA-binding protein SmpB [Planctomycetota bacterium]